MKATDRNARSAWASLTHDGLEQSRICKSCLSAPQFLFLNFGLLLGNILVLFNTGAFASLSLHATGELSVSPSHGSWIQTYYFLSLAIALPVSTWLASRLGQVRLFVSAMVMMALGSLLCAISHELSWFLVGRVLQGFFGGLTIPVSQALLLKEYPEQKKQFAVALWSAAALSPFTIGPMVGGWIADNLGWHWLFYFNIPLPLFVAGIVWALLFDRKSERRERPFDWVGFMLLAVALGSLQTVLNQGQDEDWYNSQILIAFAAVGLLSLSYFVIWELGERYPLLNLRLFARRNFTIGSISLSVSFMIMYGLLAVLLARLQATAGYTSFMIGFVLFPLFFLAKPMTVFFHRIVHRYDARWLASVNMLAFALYCWWNSTYDFFGRFSLFSEPISLGSQILEGFCLGGLFVPMTTLFLSGLKPQRQIQAVELGGMLRVIGGGIGSPLLNLIWERRAAFHQSHLLETLSNYDSFDRATLASLNSAGLHGQVAAAKVAGIANQHAAILGLDDVFRLMAWAYIVLAVFMWFAHPVSPKSAKTTKEKLHETALEDLVEEP